MRRLPIVVLLVVIGTTAWAAGSWAPDRSVADLAATWAQPPSVFVNVAGQHVHLRDEGPRDDPSPIVLLHGTAASLHTWEGWAASLRATRRVVRFDLPGAGLSGPAPDGDYSIDASVRFVAAVLDALGIRHAVLGGNSSGGWIAWETAVALPARVDALILVDAAGYPLDLSDTPVGFRLAHMPVIEQLTPFFLPRGVVEDTVRDVFGDPSKVTPALVDRYYDLQRSAGNRRALIQQFEQRKAGVDSAQIRRIRQRTLILWGSRDRLIPVSNAERFHDDIGNSRVVLFPELGHVPQEEDPAQTVAAVKNFLQ